MSITMSNKSIFSVAKTYGTSKNMTAISNAVEAVATLEAAHGIIVGDIFEVSSGWGALNGRLVRAKVVAVNDVTLEGIDTTSVIKFPAGAGIGTIREVTAWDNVTQIESVSTSGGEQQFDNNSWLDDDEEREIPTIRSARGISLVVTDDPSLAYVATLRAAADAQTPIGLRIAFTNGAKYLANVYATISDTPDIERNKSLKTKIDFRNSARGIRYAT